MRIWVDADACPVIIKEILFRAAKRTQTHLILVANQTMRPPPSPFITTLQVGSGFDVADNRIVQELEAGDLVITADIPLAAEVIDKGGIALNPRGELYSASTIKHKLAIRNFNDEMRGTGILTGGPPKLSIKNNQEFANQLDRLLARIKK